MTARLSSVEGSAPGQGLHQTFPMCYGREFWITYKIMRKRY